MIKILYYCPSESMYGDNIALIRIMPYLQSHGIIPYFVVAEKGDFTKYLESKNYQYIISNCRISHLYNLNKPIKGWLSCAYHLIKNSFKDKRAIKSIAYQIQNFNPQLIHSNSSNSCFGYKLAKYLKVKHVWHLREYGKYDSNLQFFPNISYFRHLLNDRNNFTISITPLIADYFKRKNNNAIIYDGVIDLTQPIPSYTKKKKQFLYVGRIFKKKGIETIINAFCSVANINNEYSLIIAGTGNENYVSELMNIIKQYKLEKQIQFLGYIKNVQQLMAESQALIVASDFEGFGFITAEAMNSNCYVIGKNTAGTKLQFDNLYKELGYEASSRFSNQNELEIILKEIMTEKMDVKSKLNIIQSTVRKLYNTQKSAEELFQVYKSLV